MLDQYRGYWISGKAGLVHPFLRSESFTRRLKCLYRSTKFHPSALSCPGFLQGRCSTLFASFLMRLLAIEET
jgi:hypothetical protein